MQSTKVEEKEKSIAFNASLRLMDGIRCEKCAVFPENCLSSVDKTSTRKPYAQLKVVPDSIYSLINCVLVY